MVEVIHDEISAALEYPNVVLVSTGSTDLFNGSKAAAGVDQFVSKNDLHLAIGALNSRTEDQDVSFPSKARRGCHALLRAGDFASIILKLQLVLHGTGLALQCGLVSKRRIAVLDSHLTALDPGGREAQSTCLSIQGPFARKVGLYLCKP